jgi:hypothetical protein
MAAAIKPIATAKPRRFPQVTNSSVKDEEVAPDACGLPVEPARKGFTRAAILSSGFEGDEPGGTEEGRDWILSSGMNHRLYENVWVRSIAPEDFASAPFVF